MWDAGIESAAGRATRPFDLGEVPRDRVALRETDALAHLAEVFHDREATVADLFRPPLRFASAPDPTPLFERWKREADRTASGPTLRVLTFNTGLLSRSGPAFSIEVPEIERRRAALPSRLFEGAWDVLLLQEVWDPAHVRALEREGSERGYTMFAGTRHDEHGLLTAVRKELIDRQAPQHFAEQQYAQQRRVERFPGPGIRRGFVAWTFRDARCGRPIALFNTHTTSFLPFRGVRMSQVRELGRAAAAVEADALTIVGGDINGAPFYRDDVHRDGPRGWFANTLPYHLLLHYGGLVDAHVVGGLADDVGLSRRGEDDAQHSTFTVTERNTLYARQYAGLEFPARIDHILFRDASGRTAVARSALQYTAPLAEGFELSDHYGVGTTFALGS